MAIDRAITITGVRDVDAGAVRLESTDEPDVVTIPLDVVDPQLVRPEWGRYVAGVVAELRPAAGFHGTGDVDHPGRQRALVERRAGGRHRARPRCRRHHRGRPTRPRPPLPGRRARRPWGAHRVARPDRLDRGRGRARDPDRLHDLRHHPGAAAAGRRGALARHQHRRPVARGLRVHRAGAPTRRGGGARSGRCATPRSTPSPRSATPSCAPAPATSSRRTHACAPSPTPSPPVTLPPRAR